MAATVCIHIDVCLQSMQFFSSSATRRQRSRADLFAICLFSVFNSLPSMIPKWFLSNEEHLLRHEFSNLLTQFFGERTSISSKNSKFLICFWKCDGNGCDCGKITQSLSTKAIIKSLQMTKRHGERALCVLQYALPIFITIDSASVHVLFASCFINKVVQSRKKHSFVGSFWIDVYHLI